MYFCTSPAPVFILYATLSKNPQSFITFYFICRCDRNLNNDSNFQFSSSIVQIYTYGLKKKRENLEVILI